jgi:peptidoglycan/LPS O-acetylase OafA/YrhL
MDNLSTNTASSIVKTSAAVSILLAAVASCATVLASLFLSYKSGHVTKTARDLDYIALATAFLGCCLLAYRRTGANRVSAIALAVVLFAIALFHYKNDPYLHIDSDALVDCND